MGQDLIDRLLKGESSNELDVLIEVATFVPDEVYSAARPNAAGTKVIFTRRNGKDETCWAHDWHLARGIAVTELQAAIARATQSPATEGGE